MAYIVNAPFFDYYQTENQSMLELRVFNKTDWKHLMKISRLSLIIFVELCRHFGIVNSINKSRVSLNNGVDDWKRHENMQNVTLICAVSAVITQFGFCAYQKMHIIMRNFCNSTDFWMLESPG